MEALNFGSAFAPPSHLRPRANEGLFILCAHFFHPFDPSHAASNNTHWCMGLGEGPHVMVDLENGLWAGNCAGVNPQNTPLPYPFVTAMAKGGRPGGGFALKGGDATAGAGLKKMYEGAYPPRYNMKKQGSIILGIGAPPPTPP